MGGYLQCSNVLESQAPVLPISRLAREREEVSCVPQHHSHADEFVESGVTASSHTHKPVLVSRRVMEEGVEGHTHTHTHTQREPQTRTEQENR